MSMPLKQAKERAISLGKPFSRHWSYIFIMGRKCDNYKHWLRELANLCEQLDNIIIKGNKKFDKDFFIDEFMYHLDTDKDAEIQVNSDWAERNDLPPITALNLTRRDFNFFKQFRNECFEELSELFSSKENHTKEFFQAYINKKINKYF